MLRSISRGKKIAFVAAVVVVLGVELFCRFVLGLGNPPLYVTDPQIEYMMKPDQDVLRFGNRVFVNHWGMRSPDFPLRKTDVAELRILVMGDSVINGGSVIDQTLLSTTLLQAQLQKVLGRPVVIGNASAGSWGPGNWLAFVKRYGFFDADLLVLLVGSGDYADNPTFTPLGSNHPVENPVMALQEAVFRYFLPHLEKLSKRFFSPAPTAEAPPISEAEVARGRSDLAEFLTLAQANGARKVMVFHHPDRSEFSSAKYVSGHDEIRALCQQAGVPFVDLYPAYAKQSAELYRDAIHQNAVGQQVLADALYEAVLPQLDGRTQRSVTS